MKGTVEMEYAILDICSLECVFKWSVSRPISGSSESILARYVSQVVSKHTKLGSRGAECCKRAETYWPEGLDAKWSIIWKCLLKILLLPPSTLPFQQRKKRENVLSYFLVWTQHSSYCHGIFDAQWQGLTGSRYLTRPELFFKYPTRPVPKLKHSLGWEIQLLKWQIQ